MCTYLVEDRDPSKVLVIIFLTRQGKDRNRNKR